MSRNYWVISPNVKKGINQTEWKESIIALNRAFIGYDEEHRFGQMFKNDIQIGDVILVAQGQNSNKRFFLCGIVDSPSQFEHLDETPSEAQNRKLKYTISKEKLNKLGLDFNDSSWGDSKQPATLYQLTQDDKEADQRIIDLLAKEIHNQMTGELMANVKLSTERIDQIKSLWERFKNESEKENKTNNIYELRQILNQWGEYREKILNDTLTLDDYTNILSNKTATMPGGYLCNFLERTTRTVLGSSKPGRALYFEVKMNQDKKTYNIHSESKKEASREDAEFFFSKHIKSLLKKIVLEVDPLLKVRLVESASYSAKQILMKMVVLDNLNDFLYIYSNDIIDEIYSEFIDEEAEGTFNKSYQLCLVLKNLLNINEKPSNEYDKNELILLSRFLWKYVNAKTIADIDNPNVIMYGPPGTGKTHSVVNNLEFVCQGDRSRYELLQFHPSFTYEDFIEGIKPKGVSKDGNIRFELVNGIFKNFCIKAKMNLEENRDTPEKIKPYYFVVDEINRANLSTVFGETLSLLEKNYRHSGHNNKNLIRTQYSSLIEDLIKEKEEYKSLAYVFDNGEVKFGVPENVFFIGMMNDVDKSIDSFDLALRRRFKWIRKDCDYEVIEEETKFKAKEDFSNIEQYITACKRLNNYISKDLSLGKSYEFGHSFFMKMSDIAKTKEITPTYLEKLFDLYLKPTLKEYLRAVFAESELDSKLDEALERFKKPIK